MFKLCIKFIYFGKTSKFPKKKHNLHKVFLKKNFINQRNLPPKKSIDWNLVRSKNSFFFSPNNILLKIRPIFSWHVDSVGSWFFPPGGWMKNHGHLWMNLLACTLTRRMHWITLLSSLIFYGDYKARNGVFMDEGHSTQSTPLSYFLI